MLINLLPVIDTIDEYTKKFPNGPNSTEGKGAYDALILARKALLKIYQDNRFKECIPELGQPVQLIFFINFN